MSKISINMDSLKEKKEYNRFKIQDGDNVYRVLPPFGENSNGYPYKKWSYVWLNDPNSGRRRPYASPYHLGEDRCPVKEYADALAEKIKKLENEYLSAGLSQDDIREKLKPVRSEQWKLRLTHGYVYNVADKSGKSGILEIKKTAHDGVRKKLGDYITDYGQDPTSLNSNENDSGVWLNINKTGKGTETKYSVNFNQTIEKDANGRTIRVDDLSPLSAAIVDNYNKNGYDLTTIYNPTPYDELKDILAANISELAAHGNKEFNSIPDLLIPGFTDVQTAVSNTAETVSAPAVNLNLHDKDDVVSVPAAEVTQTSEDDLFAMADSILES